MRKRVLTALVGGPVFLGLAYVGGIPFTLMVIAIGILGYVEFAHLLAPRGFKVLLGPGIFLGSAGLLAVEFPGPVTFLTVAIALALPFLGKLAAGETYSILDVGVTLLGALYLFGLMGFWIGLRMLPLGFAAFGLLVAVVWATDIFAYLAGRAWGKKKLWPRVSPGKTWVGAGVGLGSSVVAAVLVSSFAGFGATVGAVAGALGSMAGQAGDLAESALKRYAGAKDSGGVVPGHGGVLDRFDSMLLAAPVIYIVIRLFG